MSKMKQNSQASASFQILLTSFYVGVIPILFQYRLVFQTDIIFFKAYKSVLDNSLSRIQIKLLSLQ